MVELDVRFDDGEPTEVVTGLSMIRMDVEDGVATLNPENTFWKMLSDDARMEIRRDVEELSFIDSMVVEGGAS